MKTIKRWLSYIWPYPIFLGASDTIKDSDLARQVKFKEIFDKRINRLTAKYTMKAEYAVYELVHITQDPDTNITQYHIQHCATSHLMIVDKMIFDIVFQRE